MFILLALAAAAQAAPPVNGVERSTAPISVVWPSEGMTLSPMEGEFILGSVSDPKARFEINGSTVAPHSNGAFLAWLPVHPGTFTFTCSLALKDGATTFQRTIQIASAAPPLAEGPLALDAASLWPKSNADLRPGDWITPRMRASPGHPARYRVGKRPWRPLNEAGPGNYEGAWLAPPGETLKPAPVEYEIGSGWSAKRGKSAGEVSFSSEAPPIAAVKNSGVIKTSPGSGYLLFPMPGTRLVTAGRLGNDVKLSLSPTLEGWMDSKDLELMTEGTPAPRATAGTINTSAAGESTFIRVSLTEKVAFQVEEAPENGTMTLRLFNTVGYVNWIVYDPADPLVRELRWSQEDKTTVAVTARLEPRFTLWGWQASFEGGALKLELRRAPAIDASHPLKGRTIILDPGHMPSAPGAIGPMGSREMDVNFAIAKAAERLLREEGALPVLTRDTPDQEVSLVERPKLAVEKKGDIFVSIHNNALPDGENPFARPRGYSVFYYHPHSLGLSREVHRAYQQRIPLPDENLRYGNLLVARLSAMPAILVESAYMIFPSQEEKLNDPSFQKELAQAIAAGVKSFLGKEAAKQAPTAKPAAQLAPKAALKKAQGPSSKPKKKRP
ncbi:MAG: N-acetylmuramoyl-L-alanine amidase [Elusimicrobia bacterium]|nr:N-acetylmuramoyl-L-alanine amidase [Elusimicrobiota bacterium]